MDSTDRLRMHEAKKELFDLLGEEKLREALLVVLANKQAHSPLPCPRALNPIPPLVPHIREILTS